MGSEMCIRDSTLGTLTRFKLVWRHLCEDVLFRSSCLFERTSLRYPRTGLVVIYKLLDFVVIYMSFKFSTHLYRCQVRMEVYDRPG